MRQITSALYGRCLCWRLAASWLRLEADVNDFGRYCLTMFRIKRESHWSAMCRYRLEAHRYAQKAREHGYGY